MQRKEFLRLSVPAFVLLTNGRFIHAQQYLLDAEHRRKVKLRFVVASDGHYGQPKTDFDSYHTTLVEHINKEHRKHPFAFCIINGDIVHDDKAHYPAVKKILDTLRPGYYVSQGNHDHVTPAEWEQIWQIPVNFDFRSGTSSILIATSTDEKGTYLCPDVNWFRQKFDEHRSQENIFVFIHINPAKLTKNAVDCPELIDLFARQPNVRAVFNGHDHDEEGIKYRQDVPFVFDAHFGGSWGTAYRGFRIVELMKDNSIVTYIMNPTERINEAVLKEPVGAR